MTARLQEPKCHTRVVETPSPIAAPEDSWLGEDRQWAEAVLAGEKRVLEMIAHSSSLGAILEALCGLVEQTSGNCVSSIFLLGGQGKRLHRGAAPSLPEGFAEAIDGRAIGEGWGPCGIAASRKHAVIIADIAKNSPCAEYRDLALAHGLQSAWSTPILSFEGKVLGTFAVYCREPRTPTPRQRNLLEQFAHLASIAIERTRGQEALRRSQSYLAEAQKLSHTGSFGWNVTTGELIWSEETFNILGYDRALKPTVELVLQRVHPDDVPLVQRMITVASSKATNLDFEHRVLMPDGSTKHLNVIAHATKTCAGEMEFIGAIMDVTERKRAEVRVVSEKQLLERIARGGALAPILEALCRYGEELTGNLLVSILLVSRDGRRLCHGAAPSLPRSYTEAIDGALIGPCAGSCGTAVHRGETVFVSDIAGDPLWANYRDLALPHGLRACWSAPIFSSAREVIGTFALYSREPGSPTADHRNLIEQMTHLAAVAIERERAAEALRASVEVACGQVEALTRTLDALAKESVPDRLVEHVLWTITEQLKAHSGSIWLRDERTGLVNFAFAFEGGKLLTGADAELAKISPSLRIEEVSPWPEIFRTGKPGVLEDIRQGPPFPWREHVVALGVVTILIVPMLIAGQVEGVIGIRFTQKRTFRTEEMQLAQALAHQAMLACQLRRLSRQSRQTAVTAERNRMARDIHDTLAQGFTGIILQLEAVEEAMSQGLLPKAIEFIGQAGALARQSLQEARRSVQALRPQTLEENDLCEALQELIRKMTAGTGVHAEFSISGRRAELYQEWEENLLRICQEVVTNMLRHANASHFKARLVFGEREIHLTLTDDGRGFDPAARHEGFGLRGMRERVEAMGGQLSITSNLGHGVTISVLLPFAKTNIQS